jgi:hypothetical protein
MRTVKTLCTLALTMKSFGVVNVHIFKLWVKWHCLHLFPLLHANFVILFLFVWWIILDEFIMLCKDYHQYVEW